ncbi:DNA-processing protein DprA [Cryobacterium aureum]|uniref:DNA-processing protein DprA n=1 Tax=Cryobacterium aureum TaxID=995037 RepID=UPI000CF52073|nr:DNA-processing protein DprA [Cryobacterium aureum]
MDEERDARTTLAALSEPGDTITGTLVSRLGAAATVQLITSGDRLPNGIDPAEGELWPRRLAPRINPGQIDRILADMERHDLRLLTPEDIDWPGELQQLGTSAPIVLWLKGDPGQPSTPLPGRVTIVGARAATAYGSQVATELTSKLASQGHTILSGGAYGMTGHRSGSLNVAGQAHALGRPVGAVPGPVTSPASAGCHRLFQEGIASLVIDAQHVTDLLDSTAGFSGDRTFAYSATRRFSRTGPDLKF